MSDFDFAGVNWDYYTVDTNRARKFLRFIEDNLLVELLREPSRKRALLYLFFLETQRVWWANGGHWCLGHRDHKVTEFQIIGDRRKTASKIFSLDTCRADVGLLKSSLGRFPGNLLLRVLVSMNAGQF